MVFDNLGLSLSTYCLALLGAFSLGFSKAGFPGLALVNVVIMAELFGAKASVGLILPLLIVCDLGVYPLFARYATWRQAWPLIGIAGGGVVIGFFILDRLDNQYARMAIGGVILVMLSLQLVRQFYPQLLGQVEGARWFRWWSGLLMGVSTMLANAAAPAYSIYTLVNRYSKEQFLGIGARCFLFLNLFKAPLMVDLDMITPESLSIDVSLLPGLAAGIYVGKKMIHRIPQATFEALLYFFSTVAAIRMLFF